MHFFLSFFAADSLKKSRYFFSRFSLHAFGWFFSAFSERLCCPHWFFSLQIFHFISGWCEYSALTKILLFVWRHCFNVINMRIAIYLLFSATLFCDSSFFCFVLLPCEMSFAHQQYENARTHKNRTKKSLCWVFYTLKQKNSMKLKKQTATTTKALELIDVKIK